MRAITRHFANRHEARRCGLVFRQSSVAELHFAAGTFLLCNVGAAFMVGP
jgi:hypothetical protein